MWGIFFPQKLFSSRILANFFPQKPVNNVAEIFSFLALVRNIILQKKSVAEHHQGWMESDQEIIFCWVSVPFF
jgi:hypothetical protein